MGEEGGFHGQPELVAPGGVNPSLVVHPRHVHLAFFMAAGGFVRRGRGSGESDEWADALGEEGGGVLEALS